MPLGDLLPEIVLLVGALAGLLGAAFAPQRRQGWAAGWALAVLALAAALGARQIGASHLTFSGSFALDGVTVWARLLILASTAVAVALSPEWMRSDRRHGEYYAVMLLSALGATLLAGAADTMELVVALLLSSVTGATLAAYHRRSAASVEAGLKYFLIGALTNALLLVGVALLFGLAGTTRYEPVAAGLAAGGGGVALVAATALVAVGVGFKLAAVPAHAWMPDVAQGAPAPAAAFLTVVPKIGAAVALARFVQLLPEEAVGWRPLLAVLSAATMTLGNLAALRQTDVRRLLGWSAVAQSGYALMALPVLGRSDQAMPALLFFLAAYAAANLAAFAVVTELRGRTALDDYRGLLAERPAATAVLAVSLLSLVGIPPLAGFLGKLGLFRATIEGGYAWLAVLAVANTVASLFYYLRVLAPACFAAPSGRVAVLGRQAGAAMLTAGALTLLLGLAPDPLLAALADIQLLP